MKALALALALGGCTDATLGQRPHEGTLWWGYGGELTVQYWLIEDDGRVGKLSAAPVLPPGFVSGQRVRVWGVPTAPPRVEVLP